MKKVIQFILNEQAVCIETDPAGSFWIPFATFLDTREPKKAVGSGNVEPVQ